MRKCAAPGIMIAAWAAALLALVALFGACAGAEEVTPPSPAAAPGASVTPVATPAPATAVPLAVLQPAPTPIAAAIPSPAPVPADWATAVQGGEPGFFFRYPSDWFATSPGRVQSWDPAQAKNGPYFPTDGIIVDFGRFLLPSDPAAIETPPAGATGATLAGVSGWEWVITQDADPGQWKRFHQIWVDRNGYRFWLGGYFPEKDSDETIFLKVITTFSFTE